MSLKVKYAIAGVLLTLMLFCLTGYADGIAAPAPAVTGEQNTGSDNTEAQTLGTIGKGMAPDSLLVGINTLEINAPETNVLFKKSADSVLDTPAIAKASVSDWLEDPQEEEAPEEPVPSVYDGIAVAAINEAYLRVRADATVDSAEIGRMYPESKGTILEEKNGWYHIVSGNVDGYISSEYALTGAAAEEYVKANMEPVVTVATEVLRVREKPDADSAFLDYVKEGKSYSILGEENGWYLIEFAPGKTGYVSGEYVRVGANLMDAMTLDEVKAYERQKELEGKAERLGAELRGKISASEDEIYLLAALCRHEAGADSYEAALAVANVVINRMKNGYWGTGIADVIYAPGQFQYVGDGALNKYLSSPGSNCLQAARDALDGLNNIGSYLFFRSARTAVYSSYSSWVDIGGNVFYKK